MIAELLDHLRGMWRFRWYFIAVAWSFAILGWALIYKMPDIYEASAKVSVDTNSLLPDLTKGLTATENLVDKVGLVSKALLTRPNLAKVARQTDLDLRAETPEEFELLVTNLQRKISVMGRRDNIFDITYSDKDREQATRVVAALLNTFVESSLGAQGDDAEMTERALRLEIDNHEQRLLAAEAELAEFKKLNIGYMPDDGADYYTRLQAALGEVDDTAMRLKLLNERRGEIVRQLEGETPLLSPAMSASAFAASGCSRSASLSQSQQQLSALQVDFTDRHPRIVMLKETIAALEDACEAEYFALGGADRVGDLSDPLDSNPVYQNLRLQLSDTNVGIAELEGALLSRRNEVAGLRADVDKIAVVETELKKLNRDYGVIQERHQELLGRWETLQSRKRLDPVTDKVKFNILEPPFAGAAPIAPNRPLLLGVVLVLSFAAAGALAFGLNQLKPVYFDRNTLSSALGLPVLGCVSKIMPSHEVAARRRDNTAWVAANAALVVAGISIAVLSDSVFDIAHAIAARVL